MSNMCCVTICQDFMQKNLFLASKRPSEQKEGITCPHDSKVISKNYENPCRVELYVK
eukprot:TRINITY_DN9036_c0_g1_i1.p2 TRINITY_DN9036_c0_g1~~TRINITY_DN9036_c0_g1_i1.p2  ORF type:complete len:57 (+),score=10.50 TRINITY_DN9036_c0_g1_i1:257-427(+)